MSVTTGARYLAIFDCDGVLVDSEPISNRILAAAIGRAGIPMTPEEGRRLGCDQLHLDSGVGLDRADAHRLYLNAGMVIASHR